jgi:hypothetical protein
MTVMIWLDQADVEDIARDAGCRATVYELLVLAE